MEFFSITKFGQLIGISTQTLRYWDKIGKLKPHHTAPSGFRYYSEEQLKQFELKSIGDRKPIKLRKIVVYCRESNRLDLQKHINLVMEYIGNKQVFMITDVGSANMYSRLGLIKLLKMITSDEVSKLVVLYKDTLVQSGWELVKILADLHKVQLEVLKVTAKR